MKKGDRVVIDFNCLGAAWWRKCGYNKDFIGTVREVGASPNIRIGVGWDNGWSCEGGEKNFKPYKDKNASLPNLKFRRRSNG